MIYEFTDRTTPEDICYLYFSEHGIDINEDLYDLLDVNKVRNKAIIEDFDHEMTLGHFKIDTYERLAQKYKMSTPNVRTIIANRTITKQPENK